MIASEDVSDTPPAEPSPKEDKPDLKQDVVDLVKLVVWFLIIFLGLRTYVIEGYEVQGPSMDPTLKHEERILVLKLPHIMSQWAPFQGFNAIEPGDIIVFDSPDNADKRYVKRVIAMGPKKPGGNTVDAESVRAGRSSEETVGVYFDRGSVYVDNRRLQEDYLEEDARHSGEVQKLSLNSGEYYVLGDNRNVSKDSRSFDAIEEDAVIGRAVVRFWPPRKISLLK